ncbi:DUF2626 domain-containing protein [Brevibacillus humidisoli]|uniref:DUF2626 domain-containing protein n=1 Tax=Brevibacillus humidisoli TaxID=2895522 RepID=UPI001E3836FF|nr:DUF2626 domain-containing protein [Brevibacillus humidisoli]UFJ41895.1 DUF2626 domain-containing protein [Brevibacillus humidisoli]
MDRMYRVLGFWTLMIAIMAYWGSLMNMALLFFGLTAIFVALSYMGLSEKTYIQLFFGFMFISFVGFTYYTFFLMPAPGSAEHSLVFQTLL